MFTDRLTLDAPRRSQDGYLLVHAKAARAGVYDYLGIEVDPEGKTFKANDVVKVYRPASEVFDRASLASFVLRPITDDHPTVAVNSGNWRDHAGGSILGAVKDGDHVGFDLAFMDAGTITKLDSGKVELSAGYSCDLAIEDGIAADGTAYQAVQRNIRGNHVALVDRGRAGPTCRVIADAATCGTLPQSFLDSFNKEKPVSRTLTVDGLPVNVADADAATATINRLLEQRDAANGKVGTLEGQAVTDAATIVAKDAEIAKLTTDLAAAKLTPAQMRDAGKAYALTAGKAKALGVTVTDAMDEGAIMRAVVDKAMGDKAKSYSDEHVAIAFEALTKDAKVVETDILRDAITTQPVNAGDAAARETQALQTANDHNSWRSAGSAA